MRLLERTNARYLKPGDLPPGISFVSMDVSFISATLVLPAVLAAVRLERCAPLEAVILVKPQFEAGREHVGKGGIVHDPAAHQFAIDRVRTAMRAWSLRSPRSRIRPSWGRKGIANFFSTAAFEHVPRQSDPSRTSKSLLVRPHRLISQYTEAPCDLSPSSPSRRRKSLPPCFPNWSPGCGRMTLNQSSTT